MAFIVLFQLLLIYKLVLCIYDQVNNTPLHTHTHTHTKYKIRDNYSPIMDFRCLEALACQHFKSPPLF